MTNNPNPIQIFQNENGSIEINLTQGQIWLTQAQITQVFHIDQSVVSRHINRIFGDEEVDKKRNMQKMHNANSDKPVNVYSLDVVLSVGYKTNTSRAIKFRQWANTVLKDYITKGYSVNPKRLVEIKQELRFLIDNISPFAGNGN